MIFCVTDYTGNYIYKNGTLEFFNHPEGYVTPTSTPSGAEGYRYVYNYKDHLGNTRLSYAKNDTGTLEIIEESNYYPFGLTHKGYNNVVSSLGNSTAQKFKYNGVELEESLGLNLYEMDLRKYDPAIARWTSIDPVTHHSMSTYTAFDNNPVFWADPSGANSTAEWMEENGITDNDLITVYSADDYGPDNNVTVNSKTKKAEISENDNDYDTVVTDGEVSYAPKGSSRSYLESQGYTVKDLEGVGMGAVDNAILILSSEAVFAWIGRGISATWGAWFGRGASKLDDVSTTVLNSSEQAGIFGSNGGWLSFHEGVGHTIARHVAKTDAQLITRLSASRRISGASTFSNQPIAELIISSTIRSNRFGVNTWLKSGSRRNLVLEYTGNTVIGRGIMRGQSAVSNLTNARVILKPNGTGGYNILTAFPK